MKKLIILFLFISSACYSQVNLMYIQSNDSLEIRQIGTLERIFLFSATNGIQFPDGTFQPTASFGGIPEAPSDSRIYGRENENWVEVKTDSSWKETNTIYANVDTLILGGDTAYGFVSSKEAIEGTPVDSFKTKELIFVSGQRMTNIPQNDIFMWDSIDSRYEPYPGYQANSFYLGSTNPVNTTRLNLDYTLVPYNIWATSSTSTLGNAVVQGTYTGSSLDAGIRGVATNGGIGVIAETATNGGVALVTKSINTDVVNSSFIHNLDTIVKITPDSLSGYKLDASFASSKTSVLFRSGNSTDYSRLSPTFLEIVSSLSTKLSFNPLISDGIGATAHSLDTKNDMILGSLLKVKNFGTTIFEVTKDTTTINNLKTESQTMDGTTVTGYTDSKTAMEGTPIESLNFGGEIITSIQQDKENSITVAKSGGNFTTLKEAVDSIWLAGSSNTQRWSVLVYPGNFDEDNPIIIPPYTSVVGVGGVGSSFITAQNSGSVFELGYVTSMDGLTISGADLAINYDSVGSSTVSNCIINSCGIGVKMNNQYNQLYLDNIFLVSEFRKIDVGIQVESGNLVSSKTQISNSDTVGVIYDISGVNSLATISDLVTFSSNVDTALIAHDTARVVISNSSITFAHTGLVSNTYANVIFSGDRHFLIQDTYTSSDGLGKVGGSANNDDNDDALVIEGQELHVGDAAQGYEVCLGEGDSYSDDISVWTYDGSTYVDYSDSVRNIDSKGVEFPNTSIGTAIYIASTVNDTLIHHGIKVSIIDSMTVGGGEVQMQYWNGSVWIEETAMVSESNAPYAPHAKQYFEQSVGTHIRYNINMCNDSWDVSDDMSSGTDRKYVRFIITSAITESFRIDQIKLHPSRFEANSDGFTELFGNARNAQILALTIGGGKATSGNLDDITIWADENIGVGYKENNFNANGDMLGYPINFADNTDTGCPINLVMSGRSAASQTATFTVRWRIIKPLDPLYTSEPTASGTSGSYVITQDITIGLNELMFAPIDVSDAIPTRNNGFGDQLWITVERTSGTADFALTNIGAEYWTRSTGGHY